MSCQSKLEILHVDTSKRQVRLLDRLLTFQESTTTTVVGIPMYYGLLEFCYAIYLLPVL